MTRKDSFFSVLKDASLQDWRDSAVWLLYAGFGSLVPIVISVVILFVARKPVRVVDFARHAEFAIYSAALLASSTYLILKDVKRPFPSRQVFGLIIITCILLCTAFFASVTIFSKVDFFQNIRPFNESMVRNWTIGLFIFSLLIGFIVHVLDLVVSAPDVGQIHAEQERQLESAFDVLGGKNER